MKDFYQHWYYISNVKPTDEVSIRFEDHVRQDWAKSFLARIFAKHNRGMIVRCSAGDENHHLYGPTAVVKDVTPQMIEEFGPDTNVENVYASPVRLKR